VAVEVRGSAAIARITVNPNDDNDAQFYSPKCLLLSCSPMHKETCVSTKMQAQHSHRIRPIIGGNPIEHCIQIFLPNQCPLFNFLSIQRIFSLRFIGNRKQLLFGVESKSVKTPVIFIYPLPTFHLPHNGNPVVKRQLTITPISTAKTRNSLPSCSRTTDEGRDHSRPFRFSAWRRYQVRRDISSLSQGFLASIVLARSSIRGRPFWVAASRRKAPVRGDSHTLQSSRPAAIVDRLGLNSCEAV
jgi:hypothetical protein